jgi:hypothetical protein
MLAPAFMARLPLSTGNITPVTMDAAAETRNNTGAKVKIILVKAKMILTFAGIIHSRVGQPRAGDRHLNVTISASHVPLPVPVAVRGALGVIPPARLSPAQTLWTVCPDRQSGGQACVPRRVTTKDRSPRWR